MESLPRGRDGGLRGVCRALVAVGRQAHLPGVATHRDEKDEKPEWAKQDRDKVDAC